MDKPTKYLATGIVVAVLICIVGYLASIYETSQVTSLVEKCKAEVSQAPKGPWLDYQKAPLVCDPTTLAELGVNDVVGIQKEIVTANQNASRVFGNALTIAAIVFILFATPYGWYFLLRRIRELRDAIAGR
jgi:predicted PurR-regulated permease PerM